ncbi:hypothetical protein H634G_11578 [Metarhizium anisopliae BRIP 53293]|uniref:Uncharacterized protein n=1 Tax=Metarhizium anisopliae BRIP 53293 TaxID=1291518 RepID=A0A0D9NL03_METAN|nr:hypothetical protein H634G_11578 [Metarhizium anisopliae BRIP 53293]
MKTVMMERFALGGVHGHKSGVRIHGGETMLLAQYLGGYDISQLVSSSRVNLGR